VANLIKKTTPDKAFVLGVDPSLNGAGFVLMQNFKVIDFKFFTTVSKIENQFPQHAFFNKDFGPARLDKIFVAYQDMLQASFPSYIAIEDYAYGAKSNSIFQIGGLGEMLRLQSYRAGIPYRDYEPSKVKKYATGKGNAEKSQMVLEAFKEGFDVGPYGKSGEDLADAFWIARMLSDEVFLHADSSHLKKLPKYRQEVFTDISKAYPIPIMNRPFMKR
jgi:Holliday junction resolvasome RuvABC endonuclease subunit